MQDHHRKRVISVKFVSGLGDPANIHLETYQIHMLYLVFIYIEYLLEMNAWYFRPL